jgi:biopolymer transport protein ExbD
LRARVAAPAAPSTPRASAQTTVSRPVSATVAVTDAGTVAFNGDMMSLSQFIQNLRTHQAAMDPEASVVLRMPGAPVSAITWVLDEARKAGISHLTIEGSAKPDGKFYMWWF